ncbi:MAG: hypothetical protein SVM79_00845 [Chloroflexota bacterium]|nr:hypothetical protein [Chloroflexota bacterium]
MENSCAEGWMALEEAVEEKTDQSGTKWRKIYFGGGTHFQNWLEQSREVYGEDNLEIEEVEYEESNCFNQSGETMCRIWVKDVG